MSAGDHVYQPVNHQNGHSYSRKLTLPELSITHATLAISGGLVPRLNAAGWWSLGGRFSLLSMERGCTVNQICLGGSLRYLSVRVLLLCFIIIKNIYVA